ncbi:phage portal protein [Methylobacterium brachythecii]|uniref:Phage portal protein n=1 Tax=Methylobacterium brachythecii TaxID=1176177 RepID=A0A7W6ALZ3_9HYPH|nr:phage portal protein [Methylobacterium brachythecii]MBB3904194.1 lambda family phage portal protein [Methylobacterium brachythecii]GLS45144.1 phage portal protein [Methylobacterium brachythecii]
MREPARVRVRLKGTSQYFAPVASVDLSGAPAGTGTAREAAPYDAAGGFGRRSRAWRVGGYGPNTALTYALDELRQKSRDQARKNPYARAAIDRLVTNIVGTGIKPQSTAAISTVGMSKAQAKAAKKLSEQFRQAVTRLWWDWTDQADSTGAHDFYGLQAIAVRGMIEGGECFLRMRPRRLTDGLTVPLQLQVLEGDHCDAFKTNASERIRQGIQYDAIGARQGYWLYREHPGDGLLGGAGSLAQSLVPASDVCHLYRAMRPGQDRGEPWLAPALQTLYDLSGYLDAELVRKKNSAMFVGFIKRIADGQSPLGADGPDDAGSAGLAFEPGTLQILEDDEDVTFSDPKDVGPNFEAFVRQSLRGIATAAGTLYELLSGDYSQLNDRTLRAALNDFRRAVEGWQHHHVVYQVCRPVYARWIDLAILSGALILPPGMRRQDAYAAKWTPQAWPYIHPVQDVESKQMEIRAGFSTRSQKVSEGGYDAEAIDAENAQDNARADALGLIYASDGRQKTGSAGNAGAAGDAPAGGNGPTAD